MATYPEHDREYDRDLEAEYLLLVFLRGGVLLRLCDRLLWDFLNYEICEQISTNSVTRIKGLGN